MAEDSEDLYSESHVDAVREWIDEADAQQLAKGNPRVSRRFIWPSHPLRRATPPRIPAGTAILPAGTTPVPNGIIFDRSLAHTTRVVACLLYGYSFVSPEGDRIATVSQRRLAYDADLKSERTVGRILADLERRGIITSIGQEWSGNWPESYRLNE